MRKAVIAAVLAATTLGAPAVAAAEAPHACVASAPLDTTALRQAAEGRISLDGTVQQYLPGLLPDGIRR